MKDVHHSVVFSAPAHEIYEMLMDSKKHTKFTENPAEISRKVGGKCRCYDGWIEAENIELVQDKKIVQKWRGKDWKPEDYYSTATFELKDSGNGKCTLNFTQIGVPDENYEEINKGWKMHYWDRMKKALR